MLAACGQDTLEPGDMICDPVGEAPCVVSGRSSSVRQGRGVPTGMLTRPWNRVNERMGPRACLPGIFGPDRMEGREQRPQSVKRFGVETRADPCSQRGLHR